MSRRESATRLCAHTCYLPNWILKYGDKLTAAMNRDLSMLRLCCTDTQTNELAPVLGSSERNSVRHHVRGYDRFGGHRSLSQPNWPEEEKADTAFASVGSPEQQPTCHTDSLMPAQCRTVLVLQQKGG